MKKQILILLIIFNFTPSFSQDNEGIIVQYNKPMEIEYLIYNPPLKIKQVKNQSKINYSEIEGLIQSRFSVSNEKWDLSDYLDKKEIRKRDEKFYKSVKNRNFKKNYIQIETIYKFKHNNREFAYIKYSKIMDKAPFPFIGTLSAEKHNDRWYINYLYNQTNIFHMFSNFEPKVLNSIFKLKSNDKEVVKIINSIKGDNGNFDFSLMSNVFDSLMKNKSGRKLIRDKRLTIMDYGFRNAIANSKPLTYNYTINHPFLLKKSVFTHYTNKNKNITNSEKNIKFYTNKPESLLLNNSPISLINKFYFVDDNKEYYIIKYLDKTTKVVTIQKEKGLFTLLDSNKYKAWEDMFLKIKGSSFIALFQSNTDSIIKNKIKGISTGINIDLLSSYIKNN